MTSEREQTACCGLYCGDCIPANRPLFNAAKRLREELENCPFDQYARYKSRGNKIFGSFGTFREVLDALLALRCSKRCFHGGGRPDCPIRTCARGKNMEGCWQCPDFETCVLLEPLASCHGDTVKHNLRTIRQLGIDYWAHERGKHYTWTQAHEPFSLHHSHRMDNGRCHRVDLESMPWQAPAPGIRFKAYEHNGQRLRLAEFTKEFVEADWCTKGHVGYVLEGVIEVDFHKRQEVFVAGDGLFIPPGTEHGHKAHAVTNSVTLILVDGE